MKDGKIKGIGNSWALKSVPNARLRYPTHEKLLDALDTGQFFVDLLRNAPGWEEEGDLLGKETLLKDATAALYGLGPDAVPDEVLAAIHARLPQNGFDGRMVNAPIGCIMYWSGGENTVPEGWHVCDGTDGTVDLRDKFVLGAGNAHPVGSNGGSEEVTLTVEQMPAHNHGVKLDSGTSYSENESKLIFASSEYGQISNMMLFNTGGNLPHNNMPPYYALFFIQKISQSPTDFVTEDMLAKKGNCFVEWGNYDGTGVTSPKTIATACNPRAFISCFYYGSTATETVYGVFACGVKGGHMAVIMSDGSIQFYRGTWADNQFTVSPQMNALGRYQYAVFGV